MTKLPTDSMRTDQLMDQAHIQCCQDELRRVQARLGTRHECITDFEDAIRLGHELANLLAPLQLGQDSLTVGCASRSQSTAP